MHDVTHNNQPITARWIAMNPQAAADEMERLREENEDLRRQLNDAWSEVENG